MQVAFLLCRNLYFKHFGPLIDEALKRGHQVFCLHDYSQPRTGSKGYQFPDINQTPKFKNGDVVSLEFRAESELIEKVFQNNIRAIVSLNFTSDYIPVKNKLKEKKVFWVSLQSGFDSGPISGERLNEPDRFFVYSFKWLEWLFEYLKRAGKIQDKSFLDFENRLQEKVKQVGFWEAEQKNTINPEKVRREWGIPQDKKVVLLLPFPFGSSLKSPWTQCIFGWRNRFLQLPLALVFLNKKWIKQVLNQENDYRVCCAIKQFCGQNNGYLLVKSRQKDPIKNYLKKMADKVLYDEEFYPATIWKCFSIADICFSFYSGGVVEAAATGVPSVCIAPDVADWKDIQGILWQTIFDKAGDFFDFPGVSYLKTITEIIKDLPQKTLSDFPLDKEKQSQYMQKFSSGLDKNASEKIILEIEKMV